MILGLLLSAAAAAEPAPAGHPPVRWSWVATLAASSRNLGLGGAVRVGRRSGPYFSASLTTDWPFSAVVAGFLLDDVASPRLASGQVVGWSFAWPGGEHPWKPDLTVGVGVWELLEVDSLAQAFRTEDYGAFGAWSTGGQVGLSWPVVSLGLGLRPFGSSVWWHDGEAHPTAFQLTNAVLDVDVSVDLSRLFARREAP